MGRKLAPVTNQPNPINLNDHVAVDGDADRPYITGIVTNLDGPLAEVSVFGTRKVEAFIGEFPVKHLHLIGSPTKADPAIYTDTQRGCTKFYAPAEAMAVDVYAFEGDRADRIAVNWSAIGSVPAAQAQQYADLISAAATFAAELVEWANAIEDPRMNPVEA